MPTTENDRRNLQQPTLERPSLPDHDRTRDAGMHAAIPEELRDTSQLSPTGMGETGALDDSEISAPDQEFQEVLEAGFASNNGRIPNDPNNRLTSDASSADEDLDPENRGESLPDIMDGIQH